MVEGQKEKDMDTIEKAHLAAERLKLENDRKEQMIGRLEAIESRLEGRRLLGGESYAGEAPPRELTPEEKLKADARNYFKGGMLEGVWK